MDNDPDRPAGSDGDGWLNIEHAFDNILTGIIGILLSAFPNGSHEITLFGTETQFRADTQQGGKSDTLE